jgi:hypothetical protein
MSNQNLKFNIHIKTDKHFKSEGGDENEDKEFSDGAGGLSAMDVCLAGGNDSINVVINPYH